MVLVAVILIVLVVNSISSSCGISKILTWTGKYKSGVWTSPSKYKLRARAGGQDQESRPGPGAKQRAGGRETQRSN